MNLGEPTGTTQAHNREWPLYERPLFGVSVVGYVDFSGLHISPEDLKRSMEDSLRRILEPHGVKVNLYPVTGLSMSPAGQAEKHQLDLESIRK